MFLRFKQSSFWLFLLHHYKIKIITTVIMITAKITLIADKELNELNKTTQE